MNAEIVIPLSMLAGAMVVGFIFAIYKLVSWMDDISIRIKTLEDAIK